MRKPLLALAVATLWVCGSYAQVGTKSEGWHGTVLDSMGATVARAHVYKRAIGTAKASEPVVYVTDSDGDGHFFLPLEHQAKQVIIFSDGFLPGLSYITDASAGYHVMRVVLKVMPCDYPGVNCDDFGPPVKVKRRKKH